MSGGRAQESLLLGGSGEKKSEAVKTVGGLTFSCGLDGALAGPNRLDRLYEFRKHIRLRDGDIAGSQNEFQFRREFGEALHGIDVGIEIGFRAKQPDRARVVSVAGEEQSIAAIEQRDRVRRVAGSGYNLQSAAAEIDLEAVVNRARDFPGFCRVRFWIEPLWQIPAELAGSNFRLRVFTRTFRIRPRELGVHAVGKSELPVAANVIVVGVRVEHDDRTRRQLGRDSANVTDAHAGVEQKCLLIAYNQ